MSGYLYRIQSFERVISLFESKTFYFAHPSAWDDPYECRLQHRASARLFAQCWCKRSVSDAMWRIYSPNRLGVRIRTTREELERALESELADRYRSVLLDVEYYRTSELEAKLRKLANKLRKIFIASEAAKALAWKRNAFEHEAEVRAVVYDRKEHATAQPHLKIRIDPYQLIQTILVDPRAPKEFLSTFRFYMKNKLGFRGRIARSELYAPQDPITVE